MTTPKSRTETSRARLPWPVLLSVIFSAVLLLTSIQAHAASPSAAVQRTVPAGALPAAGSPAQPSSLQPNYDEQLGMTFAQGSSELAYNVTAVAQSDANGFGPGYLLNGLTDGGFWYQVGVAYSWPYQTGGHNQGFSFLYEAFNSSGTSVFPSGGGGGLDNFTGAVKDGDLVLLRLSFSGGQVTFDAHDWNTGASATQTFPATGSRFVGLRFSSGANGFFTGLMTEWYHVAPYFGSEGEVTFSNPAVRLTSATLWADEFSTNDSVSVFGDSQSFSFSNPNQLREFAVDGATEYADAYRFITGSLGKTQITLSYSLYGGGKGFGNPFLSYISNGTLQTAPLSGTPTTYYADQGSQWQITATLAGSSPVERWQTAQLANGTLDGPLTENVLFFHQYFCSFGYTVEGGGSGYSAPQEKLIQFGAPVALNGSASAWVDAGSSFDYPSSLPGSTSSERWATMNSSWRLEGPQSVMISYHHQYALTLDFSIVGGGSPPAPTLSGTSFGLPYETVSSNSSASFLDEGTSWSVLSLLGESGTSQRWYAAEGTNGTISGPLAVAVTYDHQYALSTEPNPTPGGTVSPRSHWVGAGTTVQLTEVTTPGWKFEGWAGTGNGSYSGPLDTPSIRVSAPMQENATFYPGLTIGAGADGEVTYSSSSASGTVQEGGTVTVYEPPGSTVSLRAAASSIFYSFAGWSSYPAGGGSISLTLTSPSSETASFRLNPLFLLAAAVPLGAAVGAFLLLLRRRRKVMVPSSSL